MTDYAENEKLRPPFQGLVWVGTMSFCGIVWWWFAGILGVV